MKKVWGRKPLEQVRNVDRDLSDFCEVGCTAGLWQLFNWRMVRMRVFIVVTAKLYYIAEVASQRPWNAMKGER